MKICPACGYEEHPMWRARSNRPFCSYVKADTLEYLDPELFKKIKHAMDQGKPYYYDGTIVYHITKTGLNVEKIAKQYHDYMGWGAEPQEKVDHSNLALMPKLAEYMTKSGAEITNESAVPPRGGKDE